MADDKSINLEEILRQLADNEDEETLRKTYEAYENSRTLLTSASLERVLASLLNTAPMGFLNRNDFAQKLRQAYQRMLKNGTPLDDLRGAIGLVCFTLELLNISEKDIAEKQSQALSLDWPQELLKDSAAREWLKKVYAPEEQLAEVQSLLEAAVSAQDSNVLYELAPRIAGLPTKEQAIMTALAKKGMKQASGFSLRAFNKLVKETAAITRQGKPQHVSVTTQNSPIKKQEEEAKEAEENLRLAKEHWKELNLKDPLDPDNPDPLVLYRVGTTSFILRCRINTLAGEELVLKCLLFPYTQIPDIADATRKYALQYAPGTVPETARVRSSTDKWILMDFIKGPTLQEVLEERRRSESKAPPLLRTDLLALIGQPLLRALGSLSSKGKQHEDLTPSNIILRKRSDGSIEIIFIDLGRNYLYTSHLRLEASREALFVAPEVKNMQDSDTAGLYSFGMILIDLADPIGVQGHTIPDSLYQYVPHLARFIEDLIDKKPENRLLIFHPESGQNLYVNLYSTFEDLLQVLPSEREVKPGRFFWVNQFIALLYPSHPLTHLKKLWGITFPSQTHTQIPRYPYARYLYWWLVLSTVCTSLIFMVSIVWGARDFAMNPFLPSYISIPQTLIPGCGGTCVPFLDKLQAPSYVFGITNMQARLVGFSIGLTQSAYYANILAGITARPMRSSTLAHVTELFLRGFTITALPLVLIGNLYQPAWWPELLLVGYPIPALVNVLCYQLATDTLKKAQGVISTVAPYDASLKNFGQWGTSLFCYIIVVFLISIELQNNILHDSWAYAIGAVVINVFILCLSKSIILAPGVRGSLCRAFTLGERLEKIPP